jgi:hypothetical protein
MATCVDNVQFQKILVLNLPARTERRDAMTLAAAVSDLDVDWVDGWPASHMLESMLPPDSKDKSISPGNKGSWRGHMDALRTYVFWMLHVADCPSAD